MNIFCHFAQLCVKWLTKNHLEVQLINQLKNELYTVKCDPQWNSLNLPDLEPENRKIKVLFSMKEFVFSVFALIELKQQTLVSPQDQQVTTGFSTNNMFLVHFVAAVRSLFTIIHRYYCQRSHAFAQTLFTRGFCSSFSSLLGRIWAKFHQIRKDPALFTKMIQFDPFTSKSRSEESDQSRQSCFKRPERFACGKILRSSL